VGAVDVSAWAAASSTSGAESSHNECADASDDSSAAAVGVAFPAPSHDKLGGDPFAALCLIARFYHLPADPAALRHRLGIGAGESVDRDQLLLAAKAIGLKAKLVYVRLDRLAQIAVPALVVLKASARPAPVSTEAYVSPKHNPSWSSCPTAPAWWPR
jgi:hypothetical protein